MTTTTPTVTTTAPGGGPLSLRLVARKPRVALGEDVVIDIHHQVAADLDMEAVELNRDRTRVRIERLDQPQAAPVILTGVDAAKLHRRSLLQTVGLAGRAPAGSAWTSALHLLEYTRPLPVGRYRIGLSYRVGDGDDATIVNASAVEVEVAAAPLTFATFRWFGGASARDRLGSLWAARVDGQSRWFYQVANAHDPSVVDSCADVDMPDTAAFGAPLLAHLDGIADMHYERRVAWVEAAGLGWARVHAFGRAGAPMTVPHGLGARPQPTLIDPPLQTEDGALRAALVGAGPNGAPAVSVVEAHPDRPPTCLLWPLGLTLPPTVAVYWGAAPSDAAGAALYRAEPAPGAASGSNRMRIVHTSLAKGAEYVLFETSDQIVKLIVDQWSGLGRLTAIVRTPDTLEVLGWEILEPGARDPERLASYDMRPFQPPLGYPPAIVTLAGGCAAAALFDVPNDPRPDQADVGASSAGGWLLLSQGPPAFFAASEVPQSVLPWVIATPGDGVCLVTRQANAGFVVHRPSSAEPGDPHAP